MFLTYRAVPYIDGIVDKVRATKPLYDIVTPDGIGHTVWKLEDESAVYAIAHLFDGVNALYIADGHHRTASAVRYGPGPPCPDARRHRRRALRVLHGRALPA